MNIATSRHFSVCVVSGCLTRAVTNSIPLCVCIVSGLTRDVTNGAHGCTGRLLLPHLQRVVWMRIRVSEHSVIRIACVVVSKLSVCVTRIGVSEHSLCD